MVFTRTWIDRNLDRQQRRTLVDWLLERTTAPTGEQILEGLREHLPHLTEDELPSIASCLNWKNKVWQSELSMRRMREQRDVAAMLADAGSGKDIDEANRVILQSMMLEMLRAMQAGEIEDINPKLFQALGKNVTALARQRQSEERLEADLRKAAADIERLDRENEAAKKALKNDKLSPAEKEAEMRALFGM